jgi:hypothetical protein
MIKLFGTEYSKDELLKRVGDISQIAGVRQVTLGDGPERGVRAVEFRTGTGLDFTVMADRGMDISSASYKGQSLAWRSSTGDVFPSYYDSAGSGWLRSFPGGLLTTCGLTYAGAPCVDQGENLGLHGRSSNIPASNVYADAEWRGDDFVMWAQGRVREAAVFGENIEMVRTVTAKLGQAKIWVHDKVTNLGHSATEHMFIYHCNMGFPIVEKNSRLLANVKECRPRDAAAVPGIGEYKELSQPIKDFAEQVFYLDMAEDQNGYVQVALVNEGFNNGQGFGISMRYPKSEFPNFIEWKMMGEGMYITGLEPANCLVEGRAKDRERGILQFLESGETREYHMEFEVLTSRDAICAVEKLIGENR